MIRLLSIRAVPAREFRINLTKILGSKGLDHQGDRRPALVMSSTATAPQVGKTQGQAIGGNDVL